MRLLPISLITLKEGISKLARIRVSLSINALILIVLGNLKYFEM
jgi:hypothetical protein